MDTPAGRRAVAEAAYRQAKDQFEKHDREANDRAIALYRRAVDADADYPPAYAGLAAALCEAMVKYGRPRDDVEEVIALARRAISLDAESVEGFEALAFATFARGDLRGALEAQLRVSARPSGGTGGHLRLSPAQRTSTGTWAGWHGCLATRESRSAGSAARSNSPPLSAARGSFWSICFSQGGIMMQDRRSWTRCSPSARVIRKR